MVGVAWKLGLNALSFGVWEEWCPSDRKDNVTESPKLG